jgi:hypothetical protein
MHRSSLSSLRPRAGEKCSFRRLVSSHLIVVDTGSVLNREERESIRRFRRTYRDTNQKRNREEQLGRL